MSSGVFYHDTRKPNNVAYIPGEKNALLDAQFQTHAAIKRRSRANTRMYLER
jgi:hypothetical protein